MKHPRHQLDEALLTPVRLSLMAALAEANDADFATLRELLDVADSPLSKAISHLQAIGYLRVEKRTLGGRARTWVAATGAGRRALAAHVEALQAITGGKPG